MVIYTISIQFFGIEHICAEELHIEVMGIKTEIQTSTKSATCLSAELPIEAVFLNQLMLHLELML